MTRRVGPFRRRALSGVLAGLIICAPGLIAPAAHALPVPSAHAHGASKSTSPLPHHTTMETSIGWTALGLSSGIELTGTNVSQSYTIHVPAGLTPEALTGVLHTPVNLDGGYLEVDDGSGNLLQWIRLPAVGDMPVHFRIPLTGGHVSGGSLTIIFVIRQAETAQVGVAVGCPVPSELAITSLATVFSGAALAPRTIDAFFPPVLTHVDVYTSATPSPAEQQATLQLVSALVAHYEPLALSIAVHALPAANALPDVHASPTERAIVIRSGTGPGIAIVGTPAGGTILALGGSAATLPEQVSLFTSSLAGLAQVADATVTKAAAAPRLNTASAYTFSQLGITASTSVLGQGSLSFTLDQGDLDGPLSAMTIHLIADYTPVIPPAQGTAVISVNAPTGSTVVDSLVLGRSGRLATTFTIPRPLLSRRVSVQIALSYSPRISCTPLTSPMSWTVSPRSVVTITNLTTAAGAFSALPMAFLNGMDVALQNRTIAELRDATEAVAGMQALTSAPLLPQVVGLRQVANTGFGSVIVADNSAVKRLKLNPPLTGAPHQIIAGVSGPLKVDLDGGVGSIQSFADPAHNRTILLITTTGPWALLDPLFSSLAGNGWGQLSGDVYVAGPAGHAEALTIRDSGIVPFTPGGGGAWELWFGLAFLVAAVLAVGALLRRRLSRSTGP